MAKNIEQEKKYAYGLAGIEILNIFLNHEATRDLPDDHSYEFRIRITHTGFPDNNILNIIIEVDISHATKMDAIMGSIRILYRFELPSIKEYTSSDKKITLPEELALTLNAVCISTTRGIMASTFKGTFLNNAFLPIVDMALVTSKD